MKTPNLRAASARVAAPVAARLTPARRWAVVFLLLAAGCVVVWIETNAADEWMPNAATGAVAIALTITLVEGIVQRERRESGAGRRAAAYLRLENAFLYLTIGLNFDLKHRPEPDDPVDLIAEWFEREGDLPRVDPGDGKKPVVLNSTLYFADAMSRVLAADRDVLSNELIGTMIEIEEQVVVTNAWYETSVPPDSLALYLMATKKILKAVSAFAIVLRRERGDDWMANLDRVVRIELRPDEDAAG